MPKYEGLFLLDTARAAKDWEGTEALVTNTLTRYGATYALKGRWDERKLAYQIKGHRRGTYFLAYFDAPAASMADIRRDLLLTDGVLRFLILVWPEEIPTPETLEMKRMLPDEEFRTGFRDGDERGDRGGRGDRDGGNDRSDEGRS